MKAIGLLLFALLSSQCLSNICIVNGPATAKKDCRYAEIGYGVYACCYVEKKYTLGGTNKEEKVCYPVALGEYQKIQTVVSNIEAPLIASGATNVKVDIDCASKYLFTSILSLLLFLL